MQTYCNNQKSNTVPRGVKVKPLSGAEIGEFSDQVRRILKLDDVVKLDVIDLLENRLTNIGLVYHIVETTALPPDLLAQAVPDKNYIEIREDIYLGACAEECMPRFTIVHEIGHILLHDKIPLARYSHTQPSHRFYEDSEWQADRFAAEFLMPRHLVRQYCNSPDDIVRVFGVSLASANIRWSNIQK